MIFIAFFNKRLGNYKGQKNGKCLSALNNVVQALTILAAPYITMTLIFPVGIDQPSRIFSK